MSFLIKTKGGRVMKIKKIMDDFFDEFQAWADYAKFEKDIERRLRNLEPGETIDEIAKVFKDCLMNIKGCDDIECEYHKLVEEFGKKSGA